MMSQKVWCTSHCIAYCMCDLLRRQRVCKFILRLTECGLKLYVLCIMTVQWRISLLFRTEFGAEMLESQQAFQNDTILFRETLT